MTPEAFKAAWLTDDRYEWLELPLVAFQGTNLSQATRAWLAQGFPAAAAPYLTFGPTGEKGEFQPMQLVFEDIPLPASAKGLWCFGFDEEGSPLGIDSQNQDQVVWVDHDTDFEESHVIAQNVQVLTEYLLAFRKFFEGGKLQGDDYVYTQKQVRNLRQTLSAIEPGKLSPFWIRELKYLEEEAE